jgi:RND family efflux transporter MFP subunit
MQNKKIISIIIIILVIVFGIYQVFFKKQKTNFSLSEVQKGTVVQEVSATGTVEQGEEIKLAFKNAGKIERIYVKAGDIVESDAKLAELNTNQLSIQESEAEASLVVAQATLNKLLAGARPEQIKVSQADVQNNKTALDIAKENLDQAYGDTLNILEDSYLKLYNAFNVVDVVQKKYFFLLDEQSKKFQDNSSLMKTALNEAKNYFDIAKADPKKDNIDVGLSKIKSSAEKFSDYLTISRGLCDEASYYSLVSSTDKTSLDTHRGYINTALVNITDSQQDIYSMKLSVESAEGDLQKSEDQLALLTAKPQQEDIDLYQARVNEAQAQLNLIGEQIKESLIFSPVKGQISKVDKREGEITQASEEVVYLIPADPFQVKVDIYEEDVVKLSIGNPVDITLTAYPDEILKGKVIAIDPSEKIVSNVVYYETTIGFDNVSEKIKPGMTADVIIKTQIKENVLTIPGTAIKTQDSKTFIQVLVGKKPEQREIQIGLKGSNDVVEIISGLREGEKVIIQQ